MNRIIKLIIGFLVSIFTTLASAASTPNGDAVSQAYALSKTVQTSEHVPGISLLGGQILHNQPVLSGRLPYVMSYVGSVRNSLSASNDYFDQFLTTGGWTDNYQNSVRFYSYNNSSTIGYYAIRVPGSREDIWLSNINRSTCSGGVQRGFSSDVLGRLAYDNGANIVWACSTNGYQFTENSGGGITINYRGTLYKTTSNSISQSGTVYYRIASVKSPQGDQLNFTYDTSLNMLSVADNRNNKIVFSRNYTEKRLISQVELISGIGNKQVGTFTYGSYNSQDANGKTGSIYYPIIINSTAIGTKTFEYTPIKQWGIDGYLRFKKISVSNSNAAILKSIKNITGQIQREWLVTQDYATYNSDTKTYATAQVTLQVRTPINDSLMKSYAHDYTVIYDDNNRSVSLKTKPNANIYGEGSVTYQIYPKPVYKTSAEGVSYYDDGEIEIIVSGEYPALTVDGHVP